MLSSEWIKQTVASNIYNHSLIPYHLHTSVASLSQLINPEDKCGHISVSPASKPNQLRGTAQNAYIHLLVRKYRSLWIDRMLGACLMFCELVTCKQIGDHCTLSIVADNIF